jgi:hypothetical protein
LRFGRFFAWTVDSYTSAFFVALEARRHNVRPLQQQRVPINARIKGADFERFRTEAFERGTTPAGLAASILEAWIKRNVPGDETEGQDDD